MCNSQISYLTSKLVGRGGSNLAILNIYQSMPILHAEKKYSQFSSTSQNGWKVSYVHISTPDTTAQSCRHDVTVDRYLK